MAKLKDGSGQGRLNHLSKKKSNNHDPAGFTLEAWKKKMQVHYTKNLKTLALIISCNFGCQNSFLPFLHHWSPPSEPTVIANNDSDYFLLLAAAFAAADKIEKFSRGWSKNSFRTLQPHFAIQLTHNTRSHSYNASQNCRQTKNFYLWNPLIFRSQIFFTYTYSLHILVKSGRLVSIRLSINFNLQYSAEFFAIEFIEEDVNDGIDEGMWPSQKIYSYM